MDVNAAARAWRIVFLSALAVTFGMALLPVQGPGSFSHQDKVMHAVAFGVLAWLGWRAGWRSPAWLFGVLVAFGLSIEVAQAFTATRNAELLDLLADAVGAGVAVFAMHRRAARSNQSGLESTAT